MRRWLTTFVAVALCSAALHADVTVTTVTTVEGGAAAMMGGMTSKIVTRIKGMKVRTEVEAMGQSVATVADLTEKRLMVLNPTDKTVQIIQVPAATAAGAAAPPVTLPKVEGTLKPTGRKQSIEGMPCDEYAFVMTLSMTDMGAGGQMPPEAATMLKDMRVLMNGSVWMAKTAAGAAEYAAVTKALLDAQLAGLVNGGGAGMQSNGLDKVMRGLSGGEGMPYLTEMTMTIEGSGPAADMMKQMGAMKITNRITGVSTDAIADDLFATPADYTVIKQ